MARDYDPDPAINTPGLSRQEECEPSEALLRKALRERTLDDRGQNAQFGNGPAELREFEPRRVYELRGRTYRLRPSETATLVEIGKFRIIALEHLCEFAYRGEKTRLRPEIENLIRKGLIQMKSVPHAEKGSRRLLALTRTGHRLLKEANMVGKEQALYHGFSKPRDAHHDADLYRIYQKTARKIEQAGGRHLRVVLDYELKKRVNHDLAKLGSEGASAETKYAVAERHDLQVVRGKIPLPDVRIEYDTPEGERARVDIELATSHYRLRDLVEKIRAGFSIYADAGELPHLRRVLDQRELTAEILSL